LPNWSVAYRAALLAVGVGEAHTLLRDAVDVRRPVAHQAVAVTTQVGDADVVSPDDKDIRLLLFWSHTFLLVLWFRLLPPPVFRFVTAGTSAFPIFRGTA
jgi:hypothetical protein